MVAVAEFAPERVVVENNNLASVLAAANAVKPGTKENGRQSSRPRLKKPAAEAHRYPARWR